MLAFPKSTEVDIPAVLAMSTPFLQRSVSQFNGLNHWENVLEVSFFWSDENDRNVHHNHA